MKTINISLTPRDIHIFHLLNEFWILESDTISRIVAPTTQHKTFSMRLLSLKKAGYIREVWHNERMRNKNIIYTLNTSKDILKKIYLETGLQLQVNHYNTSYSMLNHQLYLWKLLAYFIDEIRKRRKEIDILKILWSKSIQKMVALEQENPHSKYEYLDFLVIPDGVIEYWNSLYCFELENTNSYQQAEEKFRKYNHLQLRKDNKNFFPLFQEKKFVLIVGCWEYKKEKYNEMLKESYNWKSITVNIEKL